MCRVRIPGCELTTEQARTLAYVAYQSGYSILDVTTRGNVQIQGLTIDVLPGVLEALERAGLTPRQSGHDNVRNVTSHPFSGIDPEELIDTRELARDIQEALIGQREYADLPRKVNVALLGRSDPAAHGWTQDIALVAARHPEAGVGFQLLLGGTQGKSPCLSWQAPVFVEPGEVVDVTLAVVRAFRDLGDRHDRNHVRMRYLIERIGIDERQRQRRNAVLVDHDRRLDVDAAWRRIGVEIRHRRCIGAVVRRRERAGNRHHFERHRAASRIEHPPRFKAARR